MNKQLCSKSAQYKCRTNLNLGIITTQIHFAINITNKTQNFQNTSGNYKTKASTSK